MIISGRHNGPPGSGNGGYSAGIFSRLAGDGAAAEVTLRRPPPLDTPLAAVGADVVAPDGAVIARVEQVAPFQAVVPPVSYAEAVDASGAYAGFADHPFPTCYVCGPDRADGLRVFPGRLADGRTAAPVVMPDAVHTETVWAVLDCPGGWSIIAPGRPYVLGRMAAVVSALPAARDECVVVGRTVDVAGRKALVHSTLYDASGDVVAHARATWIAI
jgi:hypothetical protein